MKYTYLCHALKGIFLQKKLLSNKNISNEFKTYVILLLLLIDVLFAINNEEIAEHEVTFDMKGGGGGLV